MKNINDIEKEFDEKFSLADNNQLITEHKSKLTGERVFLNTDILDIKSFYRTAIKEILAEQYQETYKDGLTDGLARWKKQRKEFRKTIKEAVPQIKDAQTKQGITQKFRDELVLDRVSDILKALDK